jgi:predicted nucleotidyltransferase
MAFDTSVLDRAQARQRAQWEEERQALLKRLLRLLDELVDGFDLHQVYIFGSLVQPGHFTKFSDVDVAIVGLPDEQFFKFSAALSSALGRDVDLIELDSCHFAGKIRSEGLLWTPSG